jgi:hypothetical protein
MGYAGPIQCDSCVPCLLVFGLFGREVGRQVEVELGYLYKVGKERLTATIAWG